MSTPKTQQTGWCFQCGSDIDSLSDHAIGCAWGAYGPEHPEIAPMDDVSTPATHTEVTKLAEHKYVATVHRSCGCKYTATPDASAAQALRTGRTLLTLTVCHRCRV